MDVDQHAARKHHVHAGVGKRDIRGEPIEDVRRRQNRLLGEVLACGLVRLDGVKLGVDQAPQGAQVDADVGADLEDAARAIALHAPQNLRPQHGRRLDVIERSRVALDVVVAEARAPQGALEGVGLAHGCRR